MSKPARIICRVVTALLGLAVLPNLYFNSLLYFEIDIGIGDKIWGDYINIVDFAPGGIYNGMLQGDAGDLLWSNMPLLRPALVALALVALAALVMLALVVVAAVSNKKLPVLILSGVGAVLIFAAYISFGRFTDAVTAPEFNLLELISSDTIISLIGSFLSVEVLALRLSNAVSMTLILFIAVAAWTAAFMFTAPKDAKKA